MRLSRSTRAQSSSARTRSALRTGRAASAVAAGSSTEAIEGALVEAAANPAGEVRALGRACLLQHLANQKATKQLFRDELGLPTTDIDEDIKETQRKLARLSEGGLEAGMDMKGS